MKGRKWLVRKPDKLSGRDKDKIQKDFYEKNEKFWLEKNKNKMQLNYSKY